MMYIVNILRALSIQIFHQLCQCYRLPTPTPTTYFSFVVPYCIIHMPAHMLLPVRGFIEYYYMYSIMSVRTDLTQSTAGCGRNRPQLVLRLVRTAKNRFPAVQSSYRLY